MKYLIGALIGIGVGGICYYASITYGFPLWANFFFLAPIIGMEQMVSPLSLGQWHMTIVLTGSTFLYGIIGTTIQYVLYQLQKLRE